MLAYEQALRPARNARADQAIAHLAGTQSDAQCAAQAQPGVGRRRDGAGRIDVETHGDGIGRTTRRDGARDRRSRCAAGWLPISRHADERADDAPGIGVELIEDRQQIARGCSAHRARQHFAGRPWSYVW